MKQNNISILVIEEGQNGVRQFSLRRPFFMGILISFLFAAAVFGWIIYDYRTLKPKTAELSKAENLSLHHKRQIAYLGQRIQVIRQRLEELDVYDQKLRDVARIATGHEGRSLVGVGGSDSRGSGDGAVKPETEENIIQSEDPADTVGDPPKQERGAVLDFIKNWTPVPLPTSARRPGKGWVCAKFGRRAAPFGGSREFYKGVDIAARSNAQVLAPADGIVTSVDWHEGYGRRVVVAHGFGLLSIFAHLDKVLVSKGERLAEGEPIALAGGTGRFASPYVHYEIHFYGVPVDPQQYMLPILQ